jgi:hypothetical protein
LCIEARRHLLACPPVFITAPGLCLAHSAADRLQLQQPDRERNRPTLCTRVFNDFCCSGGFRMAGGFNDLCCSGGFRMADSMSRCVDRGISMRREA